MFPGNRPHRRAPVLMRQWGRDKGNNTTTTQQVQLQDRTKHLQSTNIWHRGLVICSVLTLIHPPKKNQKQTCKLVFNDRSSVFLFEGCTDTKKYTSSLWYTTLLNMTGCFCVCSLNAEKKMMSKFQYPQEIASLTDVTCKKSFKVC